MANLPHIPIADGPPPELLPTPPPELPPQPNMIDGVATDPYQLAMEPTPFVDEFAGAPAPSPALAPSPEWPPPSWGEVPPQPEGPPAPPPPAATQQAGPAGMAALDQAHAEGQGVLPAYDAKGNPAGGPEAGPAAPAGPPGQPPRQSTGDPYLDHLQHSADVHSEALLAQGEAQKQKNDFLATEGVKAAKDASTKQAAADTAYMESYQEAKAKRAELDKEAMNIANSKVDPARAWHNMSFGAQLFVGVTAALTAMTTRGMQTGQNSVLDSVNAMVKQDMEAQQMDIANRTTALGMRRGLLQDDIAAGRDLLDFQYKSINAAYGMAENQIKSYALKYDNPVINAQAADQLQTIQDARVKMGMDYETAKRQALLDQKDKAAQRAIAWKNADSNARNVDSEIEDRKARRLAAEKAAAAGGGEDSAAMLSYKQRVRQDRRERIITQGLSKDGNLVFAKDKETATDINKKATGAQKAIGMIDELDTIYAKHGYRLLDDKSWGSSDAADDKARAKYLMGELESTFSLEQGQGVIHESEYKMYKGMFGDQNGYLTNPRANLAQARESFINGVNDQLRGNIMDEEDNPLGEEQRYWQPKPYLKKPDPRDAENNPNDKKRDEVLFIDEKKGPNLDGTGRMATDEETAAYEKKTGRKLIAGQEQDADSEKKKAERDKAEYRNKVDARQTVAEWETEQKAEFEVRRQKNIAAVQRGARKAEDLPFPEVGLSGKWDGHQLKGTKDR